jgi:PAS domain S-box-containing protein
MVLLWLDVTAYAVSTVIAVALALIALGAGLQVARNRFFALFSLAAASWTGGATVVRLTLWLERGDTALVGQLSTLSYAFLGPLLLMFTTHYVERNTGWTDLAGALGLAMTAVMSVPLFSGQLITNLHLNSNGTTHHDISALGLVMSALLASYMVWSLGLFWRERRRGETYLALSVLILLLGLIVGGILDPPFPVMSFATALSIAMLGYGIVSQQLFNPLRERTAELQREITERERAEKELQRTVSQLQGLEAIINRSPAMVLLWAAEEGWPIEYISDNVEQILGYSVDDLVSGRVTWASITHPEDDARLETEVARYLEQGVLEFGQEYRLIGESGEVHWMSDRNKVLLDADGEPAYIQSIVLDVTDRKRAEADLQRVQHLLQNITDSMPSALISLDPDGRVLTWNPAAETMSGRSVDEVRGQPLWEVCPEMVQYRRVFEGVLAERGVIHQPREQVATDTGTVYRDVSAFPLEENEPKGVVLRIDDVTRRVQLEEMMLRSAKLASVGGLAAGVAHEINNPLGAMIQGAQMLQRALDTDRERTRERLESFGVDPDALSQYVRDRGLVDYLEGIRETGGRAAKIVTDLITFSRRTSSGFVLCDLNGLIDQTLELARTDYDLATRYDFRNIEVRKDWVDLPEVVCDGQQVQQVVLSLVRNAAQAMAAKRRVAGNDYRPELVLRSSVREGWVRLEVDDNGPGVPVAAEGRLFEPFFTTKGVGEGTGLGLWLCWSIVVERHKGRIWAEPGTRGGACFVVELPTGVKRSERPSMDDWARGATHE